MDAVVSQKHTFAGKLCPMRDFEILRVEESFVVGQASTAINRKLPGTMDPLASTFRISAERNYCV
jgi:hypothetical protein